MRYRSRSVLIVTLAVLTLPWVACTAGHGMAAETGGTVAQPMATETSFTLSPDERARAVALAEKVRSGMEIEPLLAAQDAPEEERLATTVAVYPPTDASDRRRLAAVTSFDYSTGVGTRVIVDLSGDEVVEARELSASSVPVTPEEEDRLKRLLRQDSAEYRTLLDAPAESYDLGLFVTTGNGDDELVGHRIVLVRPVYFRDAPVAPMAVVDLTSERILRYEN